MNCTTQKLFSNRFGAKKIPRSSGRFTNNSGFTIVEAMVSLALLAISAALALPSYRDMVEKRQVTHGAEQIMAFFNSAQSEAIKLNQVVTVSYERSGDQNWCAGITAGATPCSCSQVDVVATDYCTVNGNPRLISNAVAGDQFMLTDISGDSGGDDAYSFDPVRGLLVDLDDSVSLEMHSSSSKFQLELRVTRTGQAELCSKDDDHKVPGFGICPQAEEES